VNGSNALSVLGRQGCGGCHSITLVCSNHLLVGLQSTTINISEEESIRRYAKTNAPPELSEPAMTNIRLLSIALGVHYLTAFFRRTRTAVLTATGRTVLSR